MNSEAMTAPATNPADTRGRVGPRGAAWGMAVASKRERGTRFVAAQFLATAMQAALVTQLTRRCLGQTRVP